MTKLSRAYGALSKTYIDPWKDKKRSFVFLASIPGYFGVGLQGLVLNYDIAGYGLLVATLFHLFCMAFIGLVGVGGSFWILSKKHWRLWIGLTQIIGLSCALYDGGNILSAGLGYILTAGPFWAIFSARNARELSQENHGNEVALISYTQAIVVAGGMFCGGLLLEYELYRPALALGISLMIFTTQILVVPLNVKNIWPKAKSLLAWRRPAARLSFVTALIFAMIDMGLPTWMRLLGLTAIETGSLMALRPIIATILTPIAGNMIQKGGLSLSRVASLILTLGWFVLLGGQYESFFILPALIILTIGVTLIKPLEVNRWFKRKTLQAIMAREIALTAGRLAGLLIFMPALFLWPASFPLIGIIKSLVFFHGSRKKKSFKERIGQSFYG